MRLSKILVAVVQFVVAVNGFSQVFLSSLSGEYNPDAFPDNWSISVDGGWSEWNGPVNEREGFSINLVGPIGQPSLGSVAFIGDSDNNSGASQPQDIFFTWSLTLQPGTANTSLSIQYGQDSTTTVRELLALGTYPAQTLSGSFSIHLDPGDQFTWMLTSDFTKGNEINLVVAVPEVGAGLVAPLLLAGGLFRWWRRRRDTGRPASPARGAAAVLLGVILLGAGLGLNQARAHNLDQRFTYINLDPETLDMMRARVAAGQPAVQIGDTIGVILKSTPGPGTLTGVGGYLTFYLPTDGSFQVVGAEYLASDPSRPGYYMPVPIKGQSIIAIGSGPIGPATTLGLASGGALTLGPNILGVTEATVTAAGVHRGTIAGVYADTGIFYSTSPKTGWESWTNATAYGLLKPYLPSSVTTRYPDYLVNNRGESIRPRTYWDASQLIGFGLSSPHAPATDPNGRGSAPWGTANVVAGPESGYAWDFDLAQWAAEGYKGYSDPLIKNTLDQVGPWNRIKYPGSQISKDQAGLVSAALGYAGIDASNVGHDLSESTPLPPNTTAVRFSFGMLELGRVEVARVYVKVLDDFTTCPFPIHGDAFGGDAGGEQGGKDHLWRYYDPTDEIIDLCGGLQKSFLKPLVPPGATNTVTLTYFNGGHLPAINLAITDPLPSGITYLPNTAKVNGIPKEPDLLSPLTWYIGFVEPYDMVEVTFDVKVNTAGDFFNVATATSEQGTNHANDTLRAAYDDLLLWDKFVSPTAVAPGGTVNYTIEIDNVGTGPNGIPFVITEYLPAGFTYVSMVSKQINGALLPDALFSVNTSNPNQPIFTISQGIQAGQSLILTFKVLVAANVPPGTYCNLFKMAYEGKVLGPAPDACVNVGGGSIGDTIWRDWDGDGIQDPGEEGIPGVTVNLYAADGTTLLATTVTDANGFYEFKGLTDGTYVVKVDTSATGLVQHTNTADPDGGTASQATVTLANNSGTDLIDFGYRPTPGGGSIGDKVFEDNGAGGATANDGIWSGSEPGIPNVTVNLYEDTNGNGEIDDGDLLIATTQSNASGEYLFGTYAAGAGLDFIVDVVESDSDLSSYFTSQNKTWDSTTLGDYSVLDLAGADLDNDFGFRGVDPASIGDTVFFDTDGNGIYTAGVDLPLAGIKVSIYYDANGDGVAQPEEFAASKDTDATGFYQFSGLTPERYIVVADSADPDLPGGVQGLVPQYVVTLNSGQNYVDADFPFVELFTKTADKQAALPGDIIQYTLNLNLPGNQLYQDLTVCDPVPGADVTFVSASAGSTTGGASISVPVSGTDSGSQMCNGSKTVYPAADTWINQDNVTQNNGTAATLSTSSSAAAARHGLLYFDISSSLPAGAILDKAILSLTVSAGAGTSRDVSIRALNTAFTETGATWSDSDGGGAGDWVTAGGSFGSSDYSGTSLGTILPTTTGLPYLVDITSTVSGWIATPSNNKGLAMLAVGTAANAVTWYSREDGTPLFMPQLILYYHAQSAGTSCTNSLVERFTYVSYASQGGVPIINGQVDLNADGAVNASDDGMLKGIPVVDSFLDVNNNGTTGEAADAGAVQGFTVIAGKVDLNGSGAADGTDDGLIRFSPWTSDWVETGESDGPAAGAVFVNNGVLEFNSTIAGGRSLTRAADLTTAASATLSFNLTQNQLDSGETMLVRASGDGGTSWTTVFTIQDSTTTPTGLKTASIPTALLTSNFQLQFTSGTGAPNDIQRIDNVIITSNPKVGPVTTSALTTSFSSAVDASHVIVTLTLAANQAVDNITVPSDLTVTTTSGTASATKVSGPTLVGDDDANTGDPVTYQWTYQLTAGASGGKIKFGISAASGANANINPYAFASATSGEVQVLTPTQAASGTVCWNLGSHTQQQDGLRIAGASLYAFRGDSTGTDQEFWKYDPADGTWNSPTDPTDFGATLGGGGSLTTDGTFVYALQGDGTKVVKRYDPTANTWASLPSLADNVGNGGAIAYHAANGKLYALRGAGQKTFSQFTFTAPGSLTGTWIKTIAQFPQNVSDGGALVSVGNYLYALQGGGKRGFYRYDPAANVWLARALTPGNVDDGGALVVVDNYIYAFQGKTATFWRYDIAANTWTTMAAAPAAVGPGAALAAVGNTIFALRGNGDGTDTEFWRYSITANTWTVRSSAPAAVGWGGSLVKLGTSYN
ncbi:MAG TPA: SdrD B-like domain-containing protein [Candidatus Paceibacterota bacterium]|nr:SdrD B-like domain-containing protein [Verrucomicrobiota bacterium]HRZ56446.1 SdrD B-like domain-containing protein [Candidatus Paceibacterota bacterium]